MCTIRMKGYVFTSGMKGYVFTVGMKGYVFTIGVKGYVFTVGMNHLLFVNIVQNKRCSVILNCHSKGDRFLCVSVLAKKCCIHVGIAIPKLM